MKKILVINGPNLNMLGKRDENIYGAFTLDFVRRQMEQHLEAGEELLFVQHNGEGAIIDEIQKTGASFGIINAGAYSHYSIAIRDALEDAAYPFIEVHLSNIYSRESFRRRSVLSSVCRGVITGFGHHGYILAMQAGRSLIFA